jgi:hypothetical protein
MRLIPPKRLAILFTGSKETVSTVQHDNVAVGSAEDLYVTPRRNGLINRLEVSVQHRCLL